MQLIDMDANEKLALAFARSAAFISSRADAILAAKDKCRREGRCAPKGIVVFFKFRLELEFREVLCFKDRLGMVPLIHGLHLDLCVRELKA